MGRGRSKKGNAAPAGEVWTKDTLAGKTKEELQKIYEDLEGESRDAEYFSSASEEILIEAVLKAQADADGAEDDPKADTPQGGSTESSGVENTGDADKTQVNTDSPSPPAPPKKKGEGGDIKRVKHLGFKGKSAVIGNKVVQADADGVFEVDAAQAARLLTIPGWKEA